MANLLRIRSTIQVPDDWDHDKCAQLRGGVVKSARESDTLLPAGPVDKAIDEALAALADKLKSIDPAIELVSEVQR